MKAVIILLTIFLLIGTAEPQKQRQPPEYVMTAEDVPAEIKVSDSIKKEFLKAANELDRKTDLLIYEKKKVDKENVYLKRENARLRQELNRIDTVYINKPNFFKRLFHKKKKTKL